MHRRAIRHLRAADPVMARLIDTIGPCLLEPARETSHFEAVARSIVFQQLSGKAAATIYGRFAALCAEGAVTPENVLALTEPSMRGAGLSTQKTKYVIDLATRAHAGEIPFDEMASLDDAKVIAHLTKVKGVGVWTAQMFLLFRLGRPDVLPDLDLGVQKAIQLAYRMRKLPKPQRVQKVGAPWAPFRSIATWYLWRSLDGDAAI